MTEAKRFALAAISSESASIIFSSDVMVDRQLAEGPLAFTAASSAIFCVLLFELAARPVLSELAPMF